MVIGQLTSHETNRRRVCNNNNISQLLGDSFSVSKQPPSWDPCSHYSMNYTLLFVFVVETEELYSTCVSQPPAASVNNIFIFFYCQFHNSSQAARKWQIHVPSRLLTHWLLTIITRKLRLQPRPWAVSSPPLAWFQWASLPWCCHQLQRPRDPGVQCACTSHQ